jgi:hypothetical protein
MEKQNPNWLRIPLMTTMRSGAWRPLDPVDDDQGGARARWRRWMQVLISVFVVWVKLQVEPVRGAQ